jgi:hypothetical protein
MIASTPRRRRLSVQRPSPSATGGGARGASPFGPAVPSIVLAVVYALAGLGWLAAGEVLPGGRWFAVHLFTLGVLTNLLLTFSEHFARTLTRTVGERAAWWPVVTNLGILAVLVGLPSGSRALVVLGATLTTGSVLAAHRRIRLMRRSAVGARFVWVVRVYERAHGAFLHGAALGALLGVGLVTGPWYGGVRLAHLHANLLGWGGLTLLATLVFFGPTMARTRIEVGADDRAARALRRGATGLSLAVGMLLLTGLAGTPGLAARGLAAVGLGFYAVAVTVICRPVARVVRCAEATGPRPLVLGVTVWFPLVAWADVAVVATGAWRWLDALGVAALTGVLAQAVLAALVYLAPMLRGRTAAARQQIRGRLEAGARRRAVAVNTAVLACVLGASRLVGGEVPVSAIGWSLLGVVVLTTLVSARRPPPDVATAPAR